MLSQFDLPRAKVNFLPSDMSIKFLSLSFFAASRWYAVASYLTRVTAKNIKPLLQLVIFKPYLIHLHFQMKLFYNVV